jgi:large-conductance mechanosensitive channel
LYFLSIALSLSLVIKSIHEFQSRLLKLKEEAAPAGPLKDIVLLREIRAALK